VGVAGRQLDLFGEKVAARVQPERDPLFLEGVRRELGLLLEEHRRAERLPGGDITRATVAELRFHGLAALLPDDEARPLIAAFDAELDRLYAIEERLAGGPAG
jgi:predicted component of type VI protein secretion system